MAQASLYSLSIFVTKNRLGSFENLRRARNTTSPRLQSSRFIKQLFSVYACAHMRPLLSQCSLQHYSFPRCSKRVAKSITRAGRAANTACRLCAYPTVRVSPQRSKHPCRSRSSGRQLASGPAWQGHLGYGGHASRQEGVKPSTTEILRCMSKSR